MDFDHCKNVIDSINDEIKRFEKRKKTLQSLKKDHKQCFLWILNSQDKIIHVKETKLSVDIAVCIIHTLYVKLDQKILTSYVSVLEKELKKCKDNISD